MLGKRGAAKKAEKQMKGMDNSYREEEAEDDDDDEHLDKRSRRSRNNKSKTEDKENTRKRGRNLNESIELNVSALEDVVKGTTLFVMSCELHIIIIIRCSYA